jgi:O-antigen ligase
MTQLIHKEPANIAGNSLFTWKEASVFIIYILFFISVIFSWRAITSICTPLLLVASFLFNKLTYGSWWNPRMREQFLIACFFFFLVQFVGIIYNNDKAEHFQLLFQKSSMLAFPLAICGSDYVNRQRFQKLMFAFVHILAGAMLYCLAHSFYQFFSNDAGTGVFFYHTLVNPVLSHAIYFSILSFSGLTFLLDAFIKKSYFYNRSVHLGIIIFFFLFIILLSSKLVIIFSLIYLLVVTGLFSGSLRRINKKAYLLTIGLLFLFAGLLFFTRNPIQKRYLDLTKGSIGWVFQQEKFEQGHYLNGIQFRLLEWRIVAEILSEHNAWFYGVSLGDAQSILDKKYTDMGLYIGNGNEDHGFLGYNTHNQLLESFLQSGIAGLLAFCWICYCLIQMMRRGKNYLVSGIVVLLLIYTFNEAYLETQYGIFIAIFLPLFFYYGSETINKPGISVRDSKADLK